jgi:uncharacterized protein
MKITALYASLLAVVFIVLAVGVINERRSAKVAVGDGGNTALLRRMRVHANFAEYVPFALLLIALAESLGTSHLIVHALGVTLLAGRISHAYGLARTPENFRFRVGGMAATFTVIGTAAVACFIRAVL